MKKSIKWGVRVIEAKEVLNRLLAPYKEKLKNEKISELLYGKNFLERLKMLIK